MIQKVRAFWIEGVLEQSLPDAQAIPIHLVECCDLVAQPWGQLVQQESIERPLPDNAVITDVFDEQGGELLILGDPGAGKTTLLLQLARDLLIRAEQDAGHPIPVVFHLASWAQRRRPIVEWLVDELNTRYDIPRKVGKAWVAEDQLLLLLDGLDEVQREHRDACVAAINAFRREHGLVDLAICCRTVDYNELTSRLRLQSAVRIQLLRPDQIDRYVEQGGPQLATLRQALNADPTLRELAQTPLMLSIMAVAYSDVTAAILPTGASVEVWREHLFHTYIDRMFKRRGADSRYQREQTLRWLRWLALGLTKKSQTTFQIEQLQSTWLETPRQGWAYQLLDRLGGAAIIAIITAVVIAIVLILLLAIALTAAVARSYGDPDIAKRPTSAQVVQAFAYFLTWGATPAAVIGLVGGLLAAAIGILFGGRPAPVDDVPRLAHGIGAGLTGAVIGGVITALVFTVLVALITAYRSGFSGALNNSTVVSIFAGIVGVPLGLFAGMLNGGPSFHPRQVRVIETLSWSRTRAVRAALIGATLGIALGLFAGVEVVFLVGLFPGLCVGVLVLIAGAITFVVRRRATQAASVSSGASFTGFLLNTVPLVIAVVTLGCGAMLGYASGLRPSGVRMVVAAMLLGVVFGLFGGVTTGRVTHTTRPNLGIHRSLMNALLGGALMSIVPAILLGLAIVVVNVLGNGSITRILWGAEGLPSGSLRGSDLFLALGIFLSVVLLPVLGVIGALTYGGYASISHLALRLVLWQSGAMPWNYARFLDYAVERALLHKVGNGYIFIHRLLMEHFASHERP
jgi:hypothetical protein